MVNATNTTTDIQQVSPSATMMNQRRLSQQTATGIVYCLRHSNLFSIVPNLNAMPMEILQKILSHLTFRDCIRCTGISKRIRQIILKWPQLVNTLSNERFRHNLSQVMIPYLQHVNGLNVHAIELTADRVTSDLPLKANRELIQFMNMLEVWQCYAIEKVTIRLYCFSEQWFNKLVNLASISLSYLDLRTAIAPKFMESAITMILAYFRNLDYLNFASNKSYIMQKVLHPYFALDGGVFLPVPNGQLDLLQHWHQEMQLQSYVSTPIQHFNLSTFQLTCDSAFLNRQTVAIFQRIPNLRHLALSDYFVDYDVVQTVFHQLFQFCPYLESILYVSNHIGGPSVLSSDPYAASIKTSAFVIQVDTDTDNGTTTTTTTTDANDSTATTAALAATSSTMTTTTTVRELTISGYVVDENARWFTNAILRLFHNNCTSIEYGYFFCYSNHVHDMLSVINCFTALERLVLECSNDLYHQHHRQLRPHMYETHDHVCSEKLNYFLSKCPNLRDIKLTAMTLDRESIASLQNLPKLESVTFEDCISVYDKDIQGIICRKKWSTQTKVKVIKTGHF